MSETKTENKPVEKKDEGKMGGGCGSGDCGCR